MILFLLIVLLLNSQEILGRRGRGRGKTRSRVQIGLPITGKYRDPESDQYYNNHNVRIYRFVDKIYSYFNYFIVFQKYLIRVQKYCWHHTLIWSTF